MLDAIRRARELDAGQDNRLRAILRRPAPRPCPPAAPGWYTMPPIPEPSPKEAVKHNLDRAFIALAREHRALPAPRRRR